MFRSLNFDWESMFTPLSLSVNENTLSVHVIVVALLCWSEHSEQGWRETL